MKYKISDHLKHKPTKLKKENRMGYIQGCSFSIQWIPNEFPKFYIKIIEQDFEMRIRKMNMEKRKKKKNIMILKKRRVDEDNNTKTQILSQILSQSKFQFRNKMGKNETFKLIYNEIDIMDLTNSILNSQLNYNWNRNWLIGYLDGNQSNSNLKLNMKVLISENPIYSTYGFQFLGNKKEWNKFSELNPQITKNPEINKIQYLIKLNLGNETNFNFNPKLNEEFPKKRIRSIIWYFDSSPFLTYKYIKYLKYRKIYRICQRKEYLTKKGILKILSIWRYD